MAEVYLATDTVKQVDVALKLLRPDLALDPTFEEYFRREARVMQQLQHPNIVRFYEPMRDGELLFLVLDYIDGPNLQKYLFTNKLLPIADALHIAQALATALDYAHASGVIHRDLKPSNVLLAFNGAILLSDFGVARVAGATTTTTGMVGSPAYMAPEQIQGAILTRAADQYSLAVLLWELIASRRPFVGASAGLTGATLGERVLEEHLSRPPPTGVLPKGLDAPLRKALAKNASDRFPSCTALVQQLVAGSDTAPTTPQEWQRKIQAPQLPPPLPPPQPPSPPPPDWVRRLQAALGGFFAFLRTNKLAAGFAIITVAMVSVALLSPARTRWAIRQRVAQFVTSRSAGEHIYLWPDGTLYDGGWQDNKRNGEGTLTLPAGIKYVGAFKDDLFNGQGTITYADGTTYTGAWRDSRRNGQGKTTRSDGTTYDGAWADNMRNGQGTGTYADGTTYTGAWKDGKRFGQGKQTSPNGNIYTGAWLDDKQHGQGQLAYSQRENYYGEFERGYFNGNGTLTFANGTQWIGTFQTNDATTETIITLNGGESYSGTLTEQLNPLQGTWTSPDGYKYVGEFKDDKFNGQGTATNTDGSTYTGEFKDDEYNGQGTYTWTTGDTHTGAWKYGQRSGQGTWTSPDGTTYTGEWQDDKFNGQGTMTWANG